MTRYTPVVEMDIHYPYCKMQEDKDGNYVYFDDYLFELNSIKDRASVALAAQSKQIDEQRSLIEQQAKEIARLKEEHP